MTSPSDGGSRPEREAECGEALTRLARGVAHDLNNVLTVVSGYVDLLALRVGGNPELQADVAEIRRAADRAADLTWQLLAYGQRQLLRPERLLLPSVLDELEPQLRRLLGPGVTYRRDAAPAGTAPVLADAEQLGRVVLGLVRSAAEAIAGSGAGGTVRLSTAPVELAPARAKALGVAAGRYGFLEVADDGPLVDPAAIPRALEPFFSCRKGPQPGLALAAAHGLVVQMGGQIEMESTPSTGTTIRLYLPEAAATD
jgi:signal transduction histidine kinase